MNARGASLFFVASLAPVVACSTKPPHEPVGTDESPNTGASGYCRTTTCTPPTDYPTSDGLCEPQGWSTSETCVAKGESNAPVWWRSACVGYDLNAAASRKVSYDAFSQAVAGAFLAWTGASCPSGGRGASRASIDVRELGPVACSRATYNPSGGNQSVILFHDDQWPYELGSVGKSLVIALTTVTYDPVSGELYDADLEINSADYDVLALQDSSAPSTAYDLQTIVTHEAGHFLGLAHSPLEPAVMYKSGDTSSGTRKRNLSASDVRGICAIYPPDGTRSVSTLVDATGKVVEGACDPTPRHGFSSTCD